MVKAAVKIQSAFRGYKTRKDFWKQRERMRRQSSIHAKQQYRLDERSIPSVTSIVDDGSVSALSTNADPNIGLVPPLPTLDTTQKNTALRELKAKLSFEEIATTNQLQTEASPTIVLLGGINPLEARNYTLGGIMFVYNVRKDKWFFGGTMPEPRNYHAAVYLNGKIYVTGGYNPLQAVHGHMMSTSSTLQLTVRSKRWRKRADMHQARSCHGLVLIGETVVVLGGRDATGKLLATVERYFPKRDQWALMKSMPEPIMGMACTVLDGCIWVIGGIVNDGHPTRYAVSNRCYTFDIEKQTWFRQLQLPEGRAFSCAATLKREVWLWCGVKDALNEDGYLMSTNTVFVYNPEQVNWEQHSSIGTPKHAATLVKMGRRIFILGGMTNASGSKEVLNENDFYDRENDRYMEGAPLPLPLTGAAAVPLPIDYVATSDPKWQYDSLNDEVLHEAATKIQAVYRGYRTRSLISENKLPVFLSPAEMRARLDSYGRPELINNKWKLFQRVQIDEWPPIPNPQQSSSDMHIKLGTQPKGYTVSASSTAGRMKVRRHVALPPHVDPNLSMCGHMCNIYKRAKKIIGLRKVENLPAFAENLVTVTTLQDDSVPVILIMGGLQPKDPVNLSNGKLILRYHILKDTWEYFGALPEPRNYHTAVYYHDHIYVAGGCDPDQRNGGEMVSTNTVYCLNIHSSEWVQKADMHCCRSHHSLVAAYNRLFAIGGRDHNGRLVASIESYDIEKDKWSMMRPMSSPRMGMACVVYEDHIWCLGGIGISEDSDTVSYPVLSSVVSYDLINDSWISRPPLRCPRAFASCVVVDNCLWLCGGASRDRISNCLISMGSIDKYYPNEAEWIRKTLINNPRHCAAVVAVESCIYIFGGVSSQEWSAVSKNEMIVINDISLHSTIELPIPLTGLSAVAIPPASPSLRSVSLAMLLHNKLTFH
ncbi:beta-scruin-like [Uloborus diversus]|uniref:beta-scruin-like n=1 Tax=Uloborus diversus TaxID=327109 RepID=UPI00240A093C|nr:beta-scruin-like [Uloborus diversus]